MFLEFLVGLGEVPNTDDTIIAGTNTCWVVWEEQGCIHSHANIISDIQYHWKLFTLSVIILEERDFELLFIDTHLIPEISKNVGSR